jgi:hypothetical protein
MSQSTLTSRRSAICDLADAIKIESAPAAHANTSANGLLSHTTNAARFGEAVAKETEVSRHSPYMEDST